MLDETTATYRENAERLWGKNNHVWTERSSRHTERYSNSNRNGRGTHGAYVCDTAFGAKGEKCLSSVARRYKRNTRFRCVDSCCGIRVAVMGTWIGCSRVRRESHSKSSFSPNRVEIQDFRTPVEGNVALPNGEKVRIATTEIDLALP